jgi:hypothetical protein
MNHYIVIADHGHLRIFAEHSRFGQSNPTLEEVHAMDFPHARKSYADNDSDMAGRFQGSKHQQAAPGAPTARTGMSIDERLPLQREVERRETEDVARAINAFLEGDPMATWDFAADSSMHNEILDHLGPQARFRLRGTVAKDLVKQPTAELLNHFNRSA